MDIMEFQQWREMFYLVAYSDLTLLSQQLSNKKNVDLRSELRLVKEFVSKMQDLLYAERYRPIHKRIRTLIEGKLPNELNELMANSEKLMGKKSKRGPRTWPKNMKYMLILALESAKGNYEALERIRQFITPKGDLDRWFVEKAYDSLMQVSAMSYTSERRTEWASELKATLVRSYVIENYPGAKNPKSVAFKKRRTEFMVKVRRDASNTRTYYQKVGRSGNDAISVASENSRT